ncbi:MAG: repeat protein [Bacteroidetes bacterium]|nr:repeat protein [Bacteroidota bacterium]
MKANYFIRAIQRSKVAVGLICILMLGSFRSSAQTITASGYDYFSGGIYYTCLGAINCETLVAHPPAAAVGRRQNFTFQWTEVNFGTFSTATGDSSYQDCTMPRVGAVYCRITDSLGTTYHTDTINIDNDYSPYIGGFYFSDTAYAGDTVHLGFSFYNSISTPFSILYDPHGNMISGMDYSYLFDSIYQFIPSVRVSDSGTYMLIVSNDACINYMSTSNLSNPRIHLTVIDSTFAGPDMTLPCAILPGGSVTMAAEGTGIWSASAGNPGTATITSFTNQHTTINNFSAPGTYSFIWTFAGGQDTALVTVTAEPDAGPDRSSYIADSVTMAGIGTGTWTVRAGNPASTTIHVATSSVTVITGFTSLGTYYYYWTNSSGCKDSAKVVIGIPSAGADKRICLDGSVTMSAASTGTWNASPSNPASVTINAPSSPTTTISGFTVAGAYLFTWTTVGGIDTIKVAVDTLPNAPFISQIGTCLGRDSIVLNGTPSVTKINWMMNGGLIDTALIPVTTVAGGNGWGNAANQFNLNYGQAMGIRMDAAGNLYVVDPGNNRVQRYPPGSTSLTNGVTVAGGNGPGSAANQLNSPADIYLDASGNLYVADDRNDRVQKFPPGSTSATNGMTVAGGNGGGSAANQFSGPRSLCFDAAGNLYVSDVANNRIQRFPPGSTSASNGVTVAGGHGLGHASNQFTQQWGINIDANGYLYVADANDSRIMRYPPGSTSADTGVTVMDFYYIGSSYNLLNYPSSILFDQSGNLYVVDMGFNLVLKFHPGYHPGSMGEIVAGGNGMGYGMDQLHYPTGICLDPAGNIYVLDSYNGRVQKWAGARIDSTYVPTSPGNYTATVVSNIGCTSPLSNTVAVTACNTLAGPDQTICPNSTATMAATGSGIWTALISNPVSTIITTPSSPTTSISGFTAPGDYRFLWTVSGVRDTVLITVIAPISNMFTDLMPYHPYVCSGSIDTFQATGTGGPTSCIWYHNGLVVGDNTNIYIPSSLSYHDSIWVIGIDSLSACAPRDTSPVFHVAVFPVPAPPVMAPVGGTCLGSDSLLLSGVSGMLQIDWYQNGTLLDSSTLSVHTVAANQLNNPNGLYVTGAGDLYVPNYIGGTVLKFPAGSGATTVGTIVAGGNGGGGGANQLTNPAGIFVDGSGSLYVCDRPYGRIQKFPPGSTSSTNAVTVAGSGFGTGATQFINPTGVFVDASGNIYVADAGNARIQKFPAGSTSSTSAVTVAGGNGEGNAANQLAGPSSIFVDATGALYVADQVNHRVQKFPAGSTSATNGATVAGGNGPGADANQLFAPYAVYLDAGGDLYVADGGNHRVQKFPAGSTSATNGVTVAGGFGQGSGAAQFNFITGLSVDIAGNIYAADQNNNRVQKWGRTRIDSLYIPVAAGSYTAITVSAAGCGSSTPSNAITVNICLSDSVWPGDADHNGTADNNDLLPIGIAYGLNGFTRPDQSIIWSAHYAQDWGVQFLNGTNTKHADCNGDGVIDANDTTAIMNNFGLTHAKTGYGAPWRSGIPGITLHYSKDTVVAGDTLTVSLMLGDSANNVSGLYGLAFTYHFDPLVVDTTTCTFGFTNSFIGNSTNKISIHKDFRTDGSVKAAVTGINHANRSGYGEIARFIATITTGNINGKDLAYYGNVNYISDITAIDKDNNPITINAGTDSNNVAYEPSGLHDIGYGHVLIYPNPARDVFTIQANSSIVNTLYTISDVEGRILLNGKIKSELTHVSIEAIAPGVYILKLGDQKFSYKIIKQ